VTATKPDGTRRFAAMDFDPDVLATQVVIDQREAENTGP
jgi:hypothetical protein